MKKRLYQRIPGDLEIRILSDGRIVMIAPDEKLLEVAQILDPENCTLGTKTKSDEYDRCKNTKDR